MRRRLKPMTRNPSEADRRTKVTDDPVRAVRLVAVDHRLPMPDQAAREIAEAVLACYDSVVGWVELAPRIRWEEPGFRDHLRQRMRHKLLDKVTSEGFVPTGLPSETVHRLYAMFGAEPIPAEAVSAGAEWDLARVELTVPVRTPAVDREAAVRAGAL